MTSADRENADGVLGGLGFFPSISSVKTNLSPVGYAEVLNSLEAERFLVSAWDIYDCEDRAEFYSIISTARCRGAVVLLDSGGYESYWNRDPSWTPEKFHAIVESAPVTAAFSFDVVPDHADLVGHAEAVLAGLERDQEAAGETPVIPIIHSDGLDLSELLRRLRDGVELPGAAVPERELGPGLLQRTGALKGAVQTIKAAGPHCPLHVLGTGNPLSLLCFVAAGASTFDGLEWCQTVVDHDTNKLYHFSHYDLVRHQTTFGDQNLPFDAAALGHNLQFYRKWLDRIRSRVTEGEFLTVLRDATDPRGFDILSPMLKPA